jgi:ketosteroid isomerase-like protein
MSRENVEFLEGLFAGAGAMVEGKQAFLDALPDLIPEICDPDIEWEEDPRRADRRTYRGHAGVRESFERWLENFEEYEIEVERMVDCGDKVLVYAREEGRGSRSGAIISQPIYTVCTFRNRKLARYQEFYEERDALKAAGLSE